MDAILFEFVFVDGAVVPAAAEAVELIDNDVLNLSAGAVSNHAQEVGPIIGAGGHGPVDIGTDDFQVLVFGEFRTFTNLAVDGFFSLFVRGKACVDNSIC